jgi:hypothetical protein
VSLTTDHQLSSSLTLYFYFPSVAPWPVWDNFTFTSIFYLELAAQTGGYINIFTKKFVILQMF